MIKDGRFHQQTWGFKWISPEELWGFQCKRQIRLYWWGSRRVGRQPRYGRGPVLVVTVKQWSKTETWSAWPWGVLQPRQLWTNGHKPMAQHFFGCTVLGIGEGWGLQVSRWTILVSKPRPGGADAFVCCLKRKAGVAWLRKSAEKQGVGLSGGSQRLWYSECNRMNCFNTLSGFLLLSTTQCTCLAWSVGPNIHWSEQTVGPQVWWVSAGTGIKISSCWWIARYRMATLLPGLATQALPFDREQSSAQISVFWLLASVALHTSPEGHCSTVKGCQTYPNMRTCKTL